MMNDFNSASVKTAGPMSGQKRREVIKLVSLK
jgi:hypothetical protein